MIAPALPLPPPPAAAAGAGPVLLFDGECGLCNRIVRLLLKWDRSARLRFSPLQGPAGQAYLRAQGLPTEDFDSLVFVPDWSQQGRTGGHGERRGYLLKTDGVIAALRVIAADSGAARFLATGISLWPTGMRNAGYRAIARWRYRLFGAWRPKPLPRAEWRARFLDQPAE